MNRKALLALLFLSVFANGRISARQAKVDSLEIVLKNHTKEDTIKVNLLNEIALLVFQKEEDRAKEYTIKAGELSDKINFSKGKAESLYTLGQIISYYKSYKEALDNFQKALIVFEEINYKPGILKSMLMSGIRSANIGNIAGAIDNLSRARLIAEELKDTVSIAKCIFNLCVTYTGQGKYDLALEEYANLLIISHQTNDLGLRSRVYNNMGSIAEYQGNLPLALDYYYKSLKVAEEINDKRSMAFALGNFGNILLAQNKPSEALEYQNRALTIAEEINDKRLISVSYEYIGDVYSKTNDLKGLEYLEKALTIFEELNYTTGILNAARKIGEFYRQQGNNEKALEFFNKALPYALEMSRKRVICEIWYKTGTIYLSQKDFTKALTITLKAADIANEMKLLTFQRDINFLLSEIYAATHNYPKAYKTHKIYKTLNDSIYKEENIKKIIELEFTYKFEKEKQAIEMEQQKKDIIQTAQKRQQQIVKLSFIAGFILMSLLAFYIYRSYLDKKKSNILLTQQKEEIEAKNEDLVLLNEEITAQREEISSQRDEIEAQRDMVVIHKDRIQAQNKLITDSINYAKHIQQALLPSIDYAEANLGDHFILFKPKDIVSGDFYWSTRVNEYLIVTVADCTGHGIPGAFMSMLGISFLNEIVGKKGVVKASDILDQLRNSVIDALKQKWQTGEQKDGMDLALIVINTNTAHLQFAGAHNPLFIVTADKEFKQLKPDNQTVAINNKMRPFTNHEIQLNKGDSIYLTSDGYPDQFGGPLYSKFKRTQLKELFLSIADKTMAEQGEILDSTFERWKGEHEQIDDVTIVGLRF